MKKDHTTIKERIEKAGLKNTHVAKQVRVHPTTITRIIKGMPEFLNKEKIKEIHRYLDWIRTDWFKKKG
jgi:plasmid maintenance system antidote protein VapI